MGKLYVCVKVEDYTGLLTLNKSYLGYPSLFHKGWIHIVRCDDGHTGEFPAMCLDVVDDYD